MKRWQCPIFNETLETRSKMSRYCPFSVSFSIASYKQEMRKLLSQTKSLKKQRHGYLIFTRSGKAFKDSCKFGIAIFAWRKLRL